LFAKTWEGGGREAKIFQRQRRHGNSLCDECERETYHLGIVVFFCELNAIDDNDNNRKK
jgi:hypothetical protein